MRNLSLAFHKTYYNSLTPTAFQDVQSANNYIYESTFRHETDYQAPGPMVTHHFILTVCYPGLLIGTGNAHDSGTDPQEISMGFNMDYVTGQPYISASSVKGFLRNHFRDHREAVAGLSGLTEAQVQELEKEIFDYSDVFFDAVVYDGYNERLVGPDYMSPHVSPTQNPVPIILLKLLPEVRLSFRFRLKDSPTMTADQKEALFKKMLLSFSFGAKRSSGYGILREDEKAGKVECIRAKCPQCGCLNYRFDKRTNAPTKSWPNCYRCQTALFE